jgi:hypothetical protein
LKAGKAGEDLGSVESETGLSECRWMRAGRGRGSSEVHTFAAEEVVRRARFVGRRTGERKVAESRYGNEVGGGVVRAVSSRSTPAGCHGR